MSRVYIRIPEDVYHQVQSHLIPKGSHSEEAGFIFTKRSSRGDDEVFEFLEWYPIPPDGFLVQSDAHLEFTDETRAAVIKRAHDLDASMVEFHAHIGPWSASFSPTDLLGFQEFVPHVWWRLRGKPYLAVVVTRRDFDSLVWLKDSENPQHLDGIEVGESILKPTQLSPLRYEAYEN